MGRSAPACLKAGMADSWVWCSGQREEGSAATDSEDGKSWAIETPREGAEGKGGPFAGGKGEVVCVGREGLTGAWEEGLKEGGSRKEKARAERTGRFVPSDLSG